METAMSIDEISHKIGGIEASIANICSMMKEGKDRNVQSQKDIYEAITLVHKRISDVEAKASGVEKKIERIENRLMGAKILAASIAAVVIFFDKAWAFVKQVIQ
jgi:predicted proteasome-type protease